MAYEEIVDEYLRLSANSCNAGGYTRLSESKRSIGQLVLHKFSGNGYEKEEVERVVGVSQEVLYKKLDSGRHFGWPGYLEEEIRSGINTALQRV